MINLSRFEPEIVPVSIIRLPENTGNNDAQTGRRIHHYIIIYPRRQVDTGHSVYDLILGCTGGIGCCRYFEFERIIQSGRDVAVFGQTLPQWCGRGNFITISCVIGVYQHLIA